MATPHGFPIWYELLADEADAAERFYGAVLGWRFSRPPGGMMRDYRIAATGGAGGMGANASAVAGANASAVAGLMTRPEGMTAPGRWLVYFGVDDVERTVAEAERAGAAVHIPPTDIPGVGRFAFLADPQGQMFYVMRGADETPSRAFDSGQSPPEGHAVWNELSAPDPDAALAFYGRVLSLRAEGGMSMGELGQYRFLHAGPDCIGALMGEVPGGRPGWLVYFCVADIDAAKGQLEAAGGRSLQGPDPIPGGAFSLVAEDDRGIRFGLVGPRIVRSP